MLCKSMFFGTTLASQFSRRKSTFLSVGASREGSVNFRSFFLLDFPIYPNRLGTIGEDIRFLIHSNRSAGSLS